jgi:hypothetical protein
MLARPNNLYEIDVLIESFLKDHQSGISTIHKIYLNSADKLSLKAFSVELMDELRTGCVTFLNNNSSSIEELNSYLFYIVNAFAKKRAKVPQAKNKTRYLCPGCLFLGGDILVEFINQIFKCEVCADELKRATDPKNILFLQTFSRHNKQGYRCKDCNRFIPHPLDQSTVVSCPYFDCCFIGPWSELKRMHHPSTQSNPENLILDVVKENGISLHDTLSDDRIDILSQLEIEEELDSKVNLLRNIIDIQYNGVPYNSSDFTAKHKMLCYKAFNNILNSYPLEMVNYLLNSSRSGGFQHKIFQEYIRLLEASLPFFFKKNNKLHKVVSLLDENLNIFEGVSIFNAIVTDKNTIKNGTSEFYIGGRKAKIVKPYYIGKVLNIIDNKTKKSLLSHIKEYSFSLIKVCDIAPGTEVTVSHLRVPPHYQMGGMVYVNRVRKKIIDRARIIEKEV